MQEKTTESAGKKAEFQYLDWTYSCILIQKANLGCQKLTCNELLIVLVLRMGWQGRYEAAKKDKIVSPLPLYESKMFF